MRVGIDIGFVVELVGRACIGIGFVGFVGLACTGIAPVLFERAYTDIEPVVVAVVRADKNIELVVVVGRVGRSIVVAVVVRAGTDIEPVAAEQAYIGNHSEIRIHIVFLLLLSRHSNYAKWR